jgi:hypothetical protein
MLVKPNICFLIFLNQKSLSSWTPAKVPLFAMTAATRAKPKEKLYKYINTVYKKLF